jgi:hypothetical protein
VGYFDGVRPDRLFNAIRIDPEKAVWPRQLYSNSKFVLCPIVTRSQSTSGSIPNC